MRVPELGRPLGDRKKGKRIPTYGWCAASGFWVGGACCPFEFFDSFFTNGSIQKPNWAHPLSATSTVIDFSGDEVWTSPSAFIKTV
jgi:hypothetical protein